jgi:hypothetical protein
MPGDSTHADWLVTRFGDDSLVALYSGERWRVPAGPSLFTTVDKGIAIVVSERADTLTRFDLRSRRIVASYRTGRRPYPADVTRDGVLAFVPNRDEGTVSIIDLLNGRVMPLSTPACERPEGGALTRDDVSYIVACGGSNELTWINTASFDVVARTQDESFARPFSVAISLDGRWGLINNAASHTLSVLDVREHRILGRIIVGRQPIVVRMHPDGRRAFVSNETSGTLTIVRLPRASAPRPTTRVEVVVIGIGERPTANTSDALGALRAAVRAVRPDVVLAGIPPNRFDRAWDGFRLNGRVDEPRVATQPAYAEVLFPIARERRIAIVPIDAWSEQTDAFRAAARERLSASLGVASDSSLDEIRWARVARALEARTVGTRRILILVDEESAASLRDHLRARKDVTLLDSTPFFAR